MAAALAGFAPGGAHASLTLAEYVARPDSSSGWTTRSEGTYQTAQYIELVLTSQTWQGIPWRHQVYIVRPASLDPATRHGVLVIGGGRWRDEYERPPEDARLPRRAELYLRLAEAVRAPVVVVAQVPFQPLFGGLTEDDLIARTFDRYLETGDAEWPLLLPMVKAAVRAMDAAQAVAAERWSVNLDAFTVTGASKRGWTTWLTAAVDPRVAAFAPMVIDVVNIGPQMEHARAAWGRPSEQIRAYTERGLLQQLETARGRALLDLVDPHRYFASLSQPKLIINATNDEYWPLDALNLYWPELRGEKRVLYVPNDGHGIRDYRRVLGGIVALHESVARGVALPEMTWEFAPTKRGVALTVRADPAPDAWRIWTASASSADFRPAQWRARPPRVREGAAEFELESAAREHRAFFAELEFRAGRELPLYLSTTLQILPPRR